MPISSRIQKKIDGSRRFFGTKSFFDKPLQNLDELNKKSYFHFLNDKIKKIFKEFFPIVSKNENRKIELKKIHIGKPLIPFDDVKNNLGSYEFPINLILKLHSSQTDEKINFKTYKSIPEALTKWIQQKLHISEPKLVSKSKEKITFTSDFENDKSKLTINFHIRKAVNNQLFFDLEIIKEEQIYFGSYPMISQKGTFLINGSEKVVVLQLIRSPGVFFNVLENTVELETYGVEIIPKRGTWIDFVTKLQKGKQADKQIRLKPLLEVIINKNKTNNVLISNLFTVFGFYEDYILDLFDSAEEIVNSYASPRYESKKEEAIKTVYAKIYDNLNVSLEAKFSSILDCFFNDKRFFFSYIGRYKINHKLFLGNLLYGRILAEDLVDKKTKQTILTRGTLITKKELPTIQNFFRSGNNLVSLDYSRNKIAGHNKVQIVKVYKDNFLQEKIIKIIGTDPSCEEEMLNIADIVAIVSHLLNLSYDIGEIDDIDSLENRNVRLIEELLEDHFRRGLRKIREESLRKLNDLIVSKYNFLIVSLINSGPVTSSVRDFFNVSQLSQFLDQTNPLTELSNKRRITVLGEGGLKREGVPGKVRDIHSSFLGKICPIETPEGPNIGLIMNLAFFARINKWKFIETPYWEVKNGELTGKIVYLSALDETNLLIAPPTTPLIDNKRIRDQKVTIYFHENLITVMAKDVEYLGFAPEQMFSISTAAIPFLQNNDANRALMGANMQKQAVPLVRPVAPIVGTGIEKQIAIDSGFALIAENPGKVIYADSSKISIQENDKKTIRHYHPYNFLNSNQRTALFHRVLVKKGATVIAKQILADGSSIDHGELALGQNLRVAFMTWKGYNYEDALIISDRLVREDVFTSLHIEEFEIRRLRTKLGDEEFTRDIVNTSPKVRRFLDEEGIVLVGSEIGPRDILVGKVTPKDRGQKTPEDILLHQLFKGREQNVENNSLTVPTGVHGIVQKIKRYNETDFANSMTAEVIEVIKVYIAQKISIKEGDKLASRHGNKGVISRVLPENSMPYTADGRSIDIMINPLGVPSRMNTGQLVEMLLARAAEKLDIHIESPVFSKTNAEDLKAAMREAKINTSGKEVLYDGETGESFDQPIAIGSLYYMKLSHMVDTKIHARETGPYSLITQQPLKGKSQNGGQRFGEMEVWALESYGAAYNLRELITIKSDDIKGRNSIYQAIINNTTRNFSFKYFPESFNVLLSELKSLCLNIEIIRKHPKEEIEENL